MNGCYERTDVVENVLLIGAHNVHDEARETVLVVLKY